MNTSGLDLLSNRDRSVIRRFLRKNRDLSNPDWAYGCCYYISEQLAQRVRGSRVLHLVGSRRCFPRKHLDWCGYPVRDPRLYHAVLAKGVVTIDLTLRQFDPRSRWPRIQTLASLRQQWFRVSRREIC